MFSEIAEIALVAARLGQFLQFLKTRVILILNFTRPHAITHTKLGHTRVTRARVVARIARGEIEFLFGQFKMASKFF